MGLLPMSREGEGKDAYKRGHVQAAQAFRTMHFADYRGTLIEVILRRDSATGSCKRYAEA